ncbi:sulfurtransferase TusA family protein [Candidatus Poribacteria bacterium]|nr:sulfurtransferase TusA family protein [Candidatus Poribacteria bacterium]
MTETRVDQELDLKGEICPYTFVKSKLAMENLAAGQVLRVLFDHEPAVRNVSRSMEHEGHTVLARGAVGERLWQVVVRKA